MWLLTKIIEIVKNAEDGDPSVKNGAILKSHLEFFELVLVLFHLAISIRQETIFESSFPW